MMDEYTKSIQATEELTQAVIQERDNWQALIDRQNQEYGQAVSELKQLGSTQLAEQKELFNQLAQSIHGSIGYVCVSPNQRMFVNEAGNGIIGLNHRAMTLECSVVSTVIDGSGDVNGFTNDTDREFQKSIGLDYVQAGGFNIVRIKWSNVDVSDALSRFNDSWHLRNQGSGVLTEAAYIKLISGSIGGDFKVKQQFASDWTLMGQHSNNKLQMPHSGLLLTSNSGEMLIAMYGKVAGKFDLEKQMWGIFPSLMEA